MTVAVGRGADMAGFFQFGGRLGRLAYFGRLMAVVIVLLVAVAIAIYLAFAAGRGTAFELRSLPPLTLALLAAVLIVMTWSTLSLMVRRLRDMGLPPLPVAGLIIAFGFFDHVALANMFRTMGWRTIGDSSLLGFAIQIAVGLALLLVPSDTFADRHDAGSTGFDGPAPSPPGPRIDRRHPRREFGLRGR